MEKLTIVGWLLSILGASVLILGGVLEMMKSPKMAKQFEEIGFPPETLRPFGLIKVTIAVLSLVPATAFIGVVLATGWMGGAIAAHVRVKENYVVPVLVPLIFWVGFGLRHQDAMRLLLHF